MFGFSPLKILFTVVIIAVIWYAFKKFGRGRKLTGSSKRQRGNSPAGAVDMVKCFVCDEYVPSDNSNCGKDNCPYPS